MKTLKILPFLLLALSMALPGFSATKYGDATISQGRLTVLREGKRLVFNPQDQRVQINHEDVIRLGPDSSVVLETVEKATLTLGSNAVLHVEPWQRREKKGLMRMLFGRFRATITGLTGAERFNVKTATATIGVKGTDLTGLQTANEKTLVWVENSHTQKPVTLEGLFGDELELNVGFASAVVGTSPPSPPVQATPALQQELGNLNSTQPNDPNAGGLPPAAGEAGISGGGEGGGEGGGGEGDSGENLAEDAADAGEEQTDNVDLYRGSLDIEFGK